MSFAVVDDAPKKKEECKDKVFAYLAFFVNDIMTAYRNSYADIEKQIKEQQAIITKQNADINEHRGIDQEKSQLQAICGVREADCRSGGEMD